MLLITPQKSVSTSKPSKKLANPLETCQRLQTTLNAACSGLGRCPRPQPGQLLTSVFHWQLSASYWSCLLRVYIYMHFYTPEKGELHSLKLLNPKLSGCLLFSEAQMEL